MWQRYLCLGLFVALLPRTPPCSAGRLVRPVRFAARLSFALHLYSKLGYFEIIYLPEILNSRKPKCASCYSFPCARARKHLQFFLFFIFWWLQFPFIHLEVCYRLTQLLPMVLQTFQALYCVPQVSPSVFIWGLPNMTRQWAVPHLADFCFRTVTPIWESR